MHDHQPAVEPLPMSNEAEAAADKSWDRRASLGLALGGVALIASGVAASVLGAPEVGVWPAAAGVALELVALKIAVLGPDL